MSLLSPFSQHGRDKMRLDKARQQGERTRAQKQAASQYAGRTHGPGTMSRVKPAPTRPRPGGKPTVKARPLGKAIQDRAKFKAQAQRFGTK